MSSQTPPGTQANDEDGEERTQRLTRRDWLDLALKTLVEDGIDQVKIQLMAKRLDVARSSFYWHFESREALHEAMLDDWLTKNTGPIIERAMRPAPDINAALINVFECWVDDELFDPPLDIAVRLWARRADSVRSVVLQADSMRMEALKQMFLRHGYPEREAMIRARVIYYTQIGQYTLEDVEEPRTRFSHAATYLQIFSGHAPEPKLCAAFLDFVEEKYFRRRGL